MSKHIQIYNARPDFARRGIVRPPLGLTGTLPDYSDGVDYEARLDIVNSVGRVKVELIDGDLPLGYQLYVDNLQRQVVVKFPAQFGGATSEGFPNGQFTDGEGGWDLKTGWAVETVPYGGNPNNKALVYRGSGSSSVRSSWFTLEGAPLIEFSALWYQGPSNKDNVDLYTNLLFRDAAGNESRVRGSKVGGLTNKSWHRSEGSTSPTANALSVAMELEVFRRNSRAREVFVDDVTWTLTFPVYFPLGDYTITLRITDSTGRTATWSGVIRAAPLWDYTFRSLSYESGNWNVSHYVSRPGSSRVIHLPYSGYISYTDNDGETWSSANGGAYTGQMRASIWCAAANRFMAVTAGSSGNFWASADGSTWAQVSLGGGNDSNKSAVYYMSHIGRYVVQGATNTWYSSNGVNWTRVQAGFVPITGTTLYIPERSLVVAQRSTTSGGGFVTSSDGLNWNVYPTPPAQIGSIAYHPGLDLIFMFSGASVYTTSDFITWTQRFASLPTNSILHYVSFVQKMAVMSLTGGNPTFLYLNSLSDLEAHPHGLPTPSVLSGSWEANGKLFLTGNSNNLRAVSTNIVR